MPLRMRLSGTQVIHGPANALPLLPAGIPAVLTIHDLAIYDRPDWFPERQWLSTRLLVPLSVRRARRLICPSHATKRAVQRLFGVPDEKCRVIPHGVDREFAVPSLPAVRDRVRATLGLPERYLLQVGTIQPRKNYSATLRALATIPERERIPLIVAGAFGWKFEPILRIVQELGLARWVRFIGYVGMNDLPCLYQLAEAVTVPSYDEGFGLPVLEAFAAGVPVVAARAGAIPEIAGGAALLCDPDDYRAMADALLRLMADRDFRDQLVAAGRARSALYTWAGSAAAHRAVYAEVATSIT